MSSSCMMLVHSSWNNQPTFKLIPVESDCPYNEAIFDPAQQTLALISKEKKPALHMLPKLDAVGDPVTVKRPRENGKVYAEQRITLETYYEYYLDNPGDISGFVEKMALNADSFAGWRELLTQHQTAG